MRFEPMYDYIVVKPWITSEKRNGIIIPYDNEVVVKSEIVAVGEGHFLMSGDVKPLKAKVGDIAVFNKATASFEIKEDGQSYFILHERDCFGLEKNQDNS